MMRKMMRNTLNLTASVILTLLAPGAMAYGQNLPAPSFEVATVKPGVVSDARYAFCHGTDNEAGVPASIPLGRCITKGVPLRIVIAYAYDVPMMQMGQIISGGPQWMDDVYDIEGKAEKPTTSADMKRMLQSLLKDRFRMAVHREKKEVAAFALLVAKSGSKVQAVPKNKECVASPTLGPCHGFMGGRGRGLHGQSVSMADLSINLTNWAQRMVVDRTGLDGLFNIETTPWVPDNPGPNFAAEAGTDPANLPTLPTMLQEQLGLRLEAQKETIEVLVIDHLEKPVQ